MNKLNKYIAAVYCAAFCFLSLTFSAYASAFESSKIATGTKQLLTDITTWALIIAPIVGGLCILYFFIRRSMSDEMDEKKWNNRIVTALVSTVAAVLASTIITVLTSYFQ